jgi:hypothetical protein
MVHFYYYWMFQQCCSIYNVRTWRLPNHPVFVITFPEEKCCQNTIVNYLYVHNFAFKPSIRLHNALFKRRYQIIPFRVILILQFIHVLPLGTKLPEVDGFLHNKNKTVPSMKYVRCTTELYFTMMFGAISSPAVPPCSQNHMQHFIAWCLSSEYCGRALKLNKKLSLTRWTTTAYRHIVTVHMTTMKMF